MPVVWGWPCVIEFRPMARFVLCGEARKPAKIRRAARGRTTAALACQGDAQTPAHPVGFLPRGLRTSFRTEVCRPRPRSRPRRARRNRSDPKARVPAQLGPHPEVDTSVELFLLLLRAVDPRIGTDQATCQGHRAAAYRHRSLEAQPEPRFAEADGLRRDCVGQAVRKDVLPVDRIGQVESADQSQRIFGR